MVHLTARADDAARRLDSARTAGHRPAGTPLGRRAAGQGAARRLAVLSFTCFDDSDVFRAQIERLARTSTPVTVQQVEEALDGGAPLPSGAVLVTLEHGHRDAATTALPVLAMAGVPALAFVVAGTVGTERPYWRHEARQLLEAGGRCRRLSAGASGGASAALAALAALPDPDRRSCLAELRVTAPGSTRGRQQLTVEDLAALRGGGVQIGNHSLSFASLDRCDDYVVREEVLGAHERLMDLLGEAPTGFAFPGGAADRRADGLLRELGYRSAFLSDNQLFSLRQRSRESEGPNPLRISRLDVGPDTQRGRFDAALAGWRPAVRRRLGAVGRGHDGPASVDRSPTGKEPVVQSPDNRP